MKHYCTLLYTTSRPRFWLYLAGTYAVGYAAGTHSIEQFLKPQFWLYFLFFLIPANVFLYGINDWYDADTDQFNTKKGTQENLLHISEKKQLRSILIIVSVVSVGLLCVTPSITVFGLLLAFYILSYFYSAPPLRFKARPIIDSASNILYGLPGLIGYTITSGHTPTTPVLLAIFCWTAAMHLFSAIPDIESDKQAKLTTTAIVLGAKRSLIACLVLWAICFVIVICILKLYLLSFVALAYLSIPVYLIIRPAYLDKMYWYFPLLNTVTGFLLFISGLIK